MFKLLFLTLVMSLLASPTWATVPVAGVAGGSGGSLTNGTGQRQLSFAYVSSAVGSSVAANLDSKTFTVTAKGPLALLFQGTFTVAGCGYLQGSSLCVYDLNTLGTVTCASLFGGGTNFNNNALYVSSNTTYGIQTYPCTGGTTAATNVVLAFQQWINF